VPVAGLVFNVDYIIGQEGIVGVKTGSSPNGSSNFVFAATHSVSGVPVLIVGAVMIKGTLAQAFDASKALVHTVKAGLTSVRLFTARQTVGHYSAPWGSGTDIIVTRDLDLLAWPGQIARFRIVTHSVRAPLSAGAAAGTILVQLDAQGVRLDLVTADPLDRATTKWRLTRGL
jgi:D-alanyl-D-alanine carboxypeptidase (penicillin-binding protein 5/6)